MTHRGPQLIGDIILRIAADRSDPCSRLLRQGKMTEEEIGQCNRERAATGNNLDTLLDGQDVMMKLHISPRTLQTLRSNGTIPYTRIGRKIYYFRHDIERILKDNYTMFKIEDRYGKDDK